MKAIYRKNIVTYAGMQGTGTDTHGEPLHEVGLRIRILIPVMRIRILHFPNSLEPEALCVNLTLTANFFLVKSTG
jgi:hypothetical protein